MKEINIKRNVSLKNYTTFRIGGKAKYFLIAKEKKDIIKGINFAKKKKIPFFILGGGSNLLVADRGYNGLVIKVLNTKYKILNTKIHTEAGAPLSLIVSKATKYGLSGLEWAAGIPGTIGGAIRGNAGTKDQSIKDVVKKIEILDAKNGKIKFLKNKDCKFSYRDSIFKKKENLVILSIEIQLKKEDKNKIQEKIKKHLNYRKKTQPLKFFSAGSIFKNPSQKIFAAKLIEETGLKGRKIGDAQISKKHANFIVNLGKAKAEDVLKLIKLIKKKVKKKFKIELKEEIQFLPAKILQKKT